MNGTSRQSGWLTHVLVGTLTSAALTVLALPAASNATATGQRPMAYGQLPLQFEANQGQTDSRVKFVCRGLGYALLLTPTDAVLILRQPKGTHAQVSGASPSPRFPSTVLRLKLIGANPAPEVVGMEELPGKSHYFLGNDPSRWHTDVPTYAKVRYHAVYPGVDLIYYGNQGQLEYDFVVAPGADPNTITLAFQGAKRLHLDAQGDLIVQTPGGPPLRLHKPVVYQDVDGLRQQIAASYVLKRRRQVGVQVAAYDATKPLVVDPVLSYSTYLGGNRFDQALDITVDAAGHAYVTGGTFSTDFPVSNAAQPANGGDRDDVFITKLNTTGSALVYSTYLGGSGGEGGSAITTDAAGNAYVTGTTDSSNFPTTPGAFQPTSSGGVEADAFVTKLSADGSTLQYSTYLGGTHNEVPRGLAVDPDGNAYVGGTTFSGDFPTTHSSLPRGFGDELFVSKLNALGSSLVYSTIFGGDSTDFGDDLAIDASRNAYITGATFSSNFPTTLGAFQPAKAGDFDVFVSKLSADGSSLIYSTHLGGSGTDGNPDLALDASGNAYVTGRTHSLNFPTANALQGANAGGADAFISKLNATGSALIYSTYLGGSGDENVVFPNLTSVRGGYLALDAAGNVTVTGVTTSTNFPTTPNAFQPLQAGLGDVFVATLNATGSALTYSTYLGGSDTDMARAIAVDRMGHAYVTGVTLSQNFPIAAGAFQSVRAADADAFVTKLTVVVEVAIDIKPGSFPNSINLGSGGTVPVAIFSAAIFDATTVDPLTVTLASAPVQLKGKGTPMASFEDVNQDGRQDLVVHVETQALQLSQTDTEAILEGQTAAGALIRGVDTVRVVP